MSKETFNDRVSDLITKQFGGNVVAAAKKIGVPRNTLWQIHRGLTQSPATKVYVALAKFSGQSIDWWMTGKEVSK